MNDQALQLSVPSYLVRDGEVWRFVDPPALQLPPPLFLGCGHSFGWISRGTTASRCPWCNATEPRVDAAVASDALAAA